ncbi:MAG: chitobiase/beta-hexosaminidase C-terminal domain-containing protein [Candidatus Acidiferrum sp.]
MFTLDSTTGIVAETPASPYSASVSTNQIGMLVVAESTGQYVYLLKVDFAQPPPPRPLTLDSFRIDPITPSLVAASSQSIPINGSLVGAAADPNQHGFFPILLIFSGIGCSGGGRGGSGGGGPAPDPPHPQSAAMPAIQSSGGTFSAPQTVSISDTTAGSTIYYTTHGSTPTSASAVYSGSFSLNSAATVQALATASGYSNSSVGSAAFKFRTPAATYPITVAVTVTAAGSSKAIQLPPILLTLIVN